MPAERIEADYETLERISSMFDSVHERLNNIVRDVSDYADELCREGWVGLGSDRFEAEMEGTLKPRLNRLVIAVDQSARGTRHIAQRVADAEDTACACMRREAN